MIKLRRCPDCRGRISRSAAVCPHCGCDMVLHSQIAQQEQEAYCREHGIKETEYMRHLFENEYGLKWNSTTDAMKHEKSYVSKDPTSQAYYKKMQAQKNKQKGKKAFLKRIEKEKEETVEERNKRLEKEKEKKALLKRIEKENAKRAAKDLRYRLRKFKTEKQDTKDKVQKANEKQERVKQRRLLIKKGEPEIDYNKFIDMIKSEKQCLIIFVCSIGSFLILPWLISVSGICFSMFMYNKKVLKRLKEVFGQEISEKYNNNFQKLYTEYKDDVNNLSEK